VVIIITVYHKKETDFSHNGLAVLDECNSCKLLQQLNGTYELSLFYPLHSNKVQYLQNFNIIKADGQLFRIYHVSKNSKRQILSVNARHIFYDLAFSFIEDIRPTNLNCQQALDMVLGEIGMTLLWLLTLCYSFGALIEIIGGSSENMGMM